MEESYVGADDPLAKAAELAQIIAQPWNICLRDGSLLRIVFVDDPEPEAIEEESP